MLPHEKQQAVRARGKDMHQLIGIVVAQTANTNGNLFGQSSCVAATGNVLMSRPFRECERNELADIRNVLINVAANVRFRRSSSGAERCAP